MKKELSVERIVILDFRTGKVFVRFVPLDMIESDADEIAMYFENELKIHVNDCQYMIVNDEDFLDMEEDEHNCDECGVCEGCGIVVRECECVCSRCGDTMPHGADNIDGSDEKIICNKCWNK